MPKDNGSASKTPRITTFFKSTKPVTPAETPAVPRKKTVTQALAYYMTDMKGLILHVEQSTNPIDAAVDFFAKELAKAIVSNSNIAIVATPDDKVTLNIPKGLQLIAKRVAELTGNIDASGCLVRTKDLNWKHSGDKAQTPNIHLDSIKVRHAERITKKTVFLISPVQVSGKLALAAKIALKRAGVAHVNDACLARNYHQGIELGQSFKNFPLPNHFVLYPQVGPKASAEFAQKLKDLLIRVRLAAELLKQDRVVAQDIETREWQAAEMQWQKEEAWDKLCLEALSPELLEWEANQAAQMEVAAAGDIAYDVDLTEDVFPVLEEISSSQPEIDVATDFVSALWLYNSSFSTTEEDSNSEKENTGRALAIREGKRKAVHDETWQPPEQPIKKNKGLILR